MGAITADTTLNMMNNVAQLFPIDPEYGDGDGDEPDFCECPDCGSDSFNLMDYDGDLVLQCSNCYLAIDLTIVER